MQPTLADLAAALARDPDPDLRAALEELAAVLLQLRILQWQNARIGALLCRLSLTRTSGEVTMTSVTPLRHDGDWTVDDLRGLPDDGLQYELADGVLLVSPAPRLAHQRALGRLFVALTGVCPPELEVFPAPLDFQPTARRSLQPDLLVVRTQDIGELAIHRPLLLAVEILSPSTRTKDLLVKRALYAESGVAAMWVVDLDEPSITGWTLCDGHWSDERRAHGSEEFTFEVPFPVAVTPASLL